MERTTPRCRSNTVIRIRNIYHMLAYAFPPLKAQEYRFLDTEAAEHALELYAQILITGIRSQLKRGIVRTYEEKTEELPRVRGKILLHESLLSQSLHRGRIFCAYDEFTEDNDFNRILCSVAEVLLKTDIHERHKKSLQHLLHYFPNVQRYPLRKLSWNVHYTRQTQSYRMLIGICKLLVEGLIQSSAAGETKLLAFHDEAHLNSLYEKFLLAYFKKTFPCLKISSHRIKWNITEGDSDSLPGMLSDIFITDETHTLIIDAKFYQHILQEYYGKQSHHPHNLNQILNYVHQESADHPTEYEVSGMLLYAGTDEHVPDKEFVTCGKRIFIKTLDLNTDFSTIRKSLNSIIQHEFPHAIPQT